MIDPTAPINVLVVDDREENRLAMRAILSAGGYRIVEAASGAEALRRLLDDDFAVLLVDVLMPQMSGFELVEAIRARQRSASVPVIFLTAEAADVEQVFRAYRAGAVDYLVKPVVPEMVQAKVEVFAELYRQKKRIQAQADRLVDVERREAEISLVELRMSSERRYRSLAEALPQIVWIGRPDGTVEYFNQRWFELTGISAVRTAAAWTVAMHPDDRSAFEAAWKEARVDGAVFTVEARLRELDGSYRWHLGRAVPETAADGSVVSWLGTFTDIEEQKRAHAALAQFKETLDAVADAIMILDPATLRLSYANHGASALLGHERGELLGMPMSTFLTDETHFRGVVSSLADRADDVVMLETRYRTRGGRLVPVEVSLQPIRTDETRIVSIARDVTDRKRAELERELLYDEARRAVQGRDRFLAVAAHELRTPLAALRLQIDELLVSGRKGDRDAIPRAELEPKLDRVGRQVDRVGDLITKVTDISRARTGGLQLEPEQVSLDVTARDVVGRLAEQADRAGVVVTIEAEPVHGRWDRLRLEQVVTNLLTNALKFGRGKPVSVTVESSSRGGRLTVRDRGIGISTEDAARIFEPFERAPGARAVGGTGLGLYIARQIVDAHGGTIRVESQPGEGATFIVELPPDVPARDATHGEAAAAREGVH
ncbi:MAG: PAS domain S-box protein [Labilithrix sp.]|nr:PAS domain S-box protein [Labilithrix sp.]